jgi:peptide/nickel transport system permease protein
VLIESALSFLGFGVPPTVVTWGSMLAKARGSIASWWLVVFPGTMIFLTVAAYNLIGDALRDALDPRLRV